VFDVERIALNPSSALPLRLGTLRHARDRQPRRVLPLGSGARGSAAMACPHWPCSWASLSPPGLACVALLAPLAVKILAGAAGGRLNWGGYRLARCQRRRVPALSAAAVARRR
jgi:hypothetical protein